MTKTGSNIWAVTAKNRKLVAAFQKSLKDNFEDIKKMLDEDDFPVEVFHESGYSKVFHSSEHLEKFISELAAQLAA
jgi:hypothetical protein